MGPESAGARVQRTIYRPYGNWDYNLKSQWDLTEPAESRSYIGGRLDADAGLLFLSTRYMDPQLGMFTHRDWSQVTEAGVGTNRDPQADGGRCRGCAKVTII